MQPFLSSFEMFYVITISTVLGFQVLKINLEYLNCFYICQNKRNQFGSVLTYLINSSVEKQVLSIKAQDQTTLLITPSLQERVCRSQRGPEGVPSEQWDAVIPAIPGQCWSQLCNCSCPVGLLATALAQSKFDSRPWGQIASVLICHIKLKMLCDSGTSCMCVSAF